MERKIITTADGSTTIHLKDWDEHYHSKHGAFQEAMHVFIRMGLIHKLSNSSPKKLSILEIGFGTGLNALVTWNETRNRKIQLHYVGVEAYPVSMEEVEKLNFAGILEDAAAAKFFKRMHELPWEETVELDNFFHLQKEQKFFQEIEAKDRFDLIYFDAFGARVQPELWTEAIFKKMFKALRPDGVLVTYAAKGSVRRAMQEVGFKVERLPGPPGKREMLRATRKQ